jgi:hypothetical protein
MTDLESLLDTVHNPKVGDATKMELSKSRLMNAVVEYIDKEKAKKKKLAEGLVKVEKSLKNGQLLSSQNALSHLVYLLQEYLK